ncbi:MAG: NUDIX hydrolase [Paracoccaceae bacterium]
MAGQLIGAKIALFVGDKLATLLRDDLPGLIWAGYWDVPGGGIEGDETPLQCVLRELEEELCVALDPSLVQWGREYGTSNGDISWFFAAHAPASLEQQMSLGDEGQDWALMTVDAFLEHKRVVPQFKPRLQDYLAGVQSAVIDRNHVDVP